AVGDGLGAAGPGDGDDHRGLGQLPGQGDLLGGDAVGLGDLGEGAVAAAQVAAPRGPQGRKGIRRPAQKASSPSERRKRGENSFWTLATSTSSRAWLIWSTLTLERPTSRTLPVARSSARAPTDSANGTLGSGRWNW